MPVWDDLLTEDERRVFAVFRQLKPLGLRPALVDRPGSTVIRGSANPATGRRHAP